MRKKYCTTKKYIYDYAKSLFALKVALAFPFSLSWHIPFQGMQVKFDEFGPQ